MKPRFGVRWFSFTPEACVTSSYVRPQKTSYMILEKFIHTEMTQT